MIPEDYAQTIYDNDRYQDEMIEDLFGNADFDEKGGVKDTRSTSKREHFAARGKMMDLRQPGDQDIQRMVRQDVRNVMAKMKTDHGGEAPIRVRQNNRKVKTEKEAQDKGFTEIKKGKNKKKKIAPSKKISNKPYDGAKGEKRSYYMNQPPSTPEYIDVTDVTEERYEQHTETTQRTENRTFDQAESDQNVEKKVVKPQTPQYETVNEVEETGTCDGTSEKKTNHGEISKDDFVVETTNQKESKTNKDPLVSWLIKKELRCQNQVTSFTKSNFKEKDTPSESVEIVLGDDYEKIRRLEKENQRLKDTLFFLQQTAVDKEKYYAELAWFGKRSKEEVADTRPDFWKERREDFGPKLFADFQADARRIGDPDVGDWEHGFASGSLVSHILICEAIICYATQDLVSTNSLCVFIGYG